MLEDLSQKTGQLSQAFLSANSGRLRQLSNQCTYRAAVENSALYAELAVLSYALHKLTTKVHVQQFSEWKKIRQNIIAGLLDGQAALKQKNVPGFQKLLAQLQASIFKIDSKSGYFVQNLLEKSRVKQASSLYALGLSLSQAAALTGADKKDLFNYIGYTKMHDEQPSGSKIAPRVKRLDGVLS